MICLALNQRKSLFSQKWSPLLRSDEMKRPLLWYMRNRHVNRIIASGLRLGRDKSIIQTPACLFCGLMQIQHDLMIR